MQHVVQTLDKEIRDFRLLMSASVMVTRKPYRNISFCSKFAVKIFRAIVTDADIGQCWKSNVSPYIFVRFLSIHFLFVCF